MNNKNFEFNAIWYVHNITADFYIFDMSVGNRKPTL